MTNEVIFPSLSRFWRGYISESKYEECNLDWDITVVMIGIISNDSRKTSKLIYSQQSPVLRS